MSSGEIGQILLAMGLAALGWLIKHLIDGVQSKLDRLSDSVQTYGKEHAIQATKMSALDRRVTNVENRVYETPTNPGFRPRESG